MNNTTLIDRNSRTSSSDFIYFILLRFFSLSFLPFSPLFAPLFLCDFFLHLFSSLLVIALYTLCLFLSPSPSLFLSLSYAHMWRCDYGDGRERTGAVRFLRPVWLHRSARREPCCTEGKDYHPCSEPSGELFFTYRFTPVYGPANGPSLRPIGQPIGVDSWYLGYISATHQSPLVTGSTTLESSCQPQILLLC